MSVSLVKEAPTATFTNGAFGQQFGGLLFKPHIGPVGGELVEHAIMVASSIWTASQFSQIENRDWHAPGALAGNAPVRPVFDHAVDPLAPPVGHPLHPVDRLQRFFAAARFSPWR
jgi:hypothetical protein